MPVALHLLALDCFGVGTLGVGLEELFELPGEFCTLVLFGDFQHGGAGVRVQFAG